MKLRRPIFILLVVLCTSSLVHWYTSTSVRALSPDCSQPASNILPDKWETCRLEYEKEADLLGSANATNREELTSLQKQLTSLSQRIKALGNQIDSLSKDITNREVDIGVQEKLLSARIRDYYIKSHYFSPLLIFFSSKTATDLSRELSLRNAVMTNDKNAILSLSQKVTQLTSDKTTVQKNKDSLTALAKKVDDRATFLQGEVKKTESYLAALSAKQQELIALKAGGFSTSVGDVPPADDPASRPDYNPGFSPAFAAFSFGAPHRKGMSQYGAFGRAKLGQSVEDILHAYYGGGIEIKKDYSNETIVLGRYNSQGKLICDQGSVDLETYAKRIYEMPGSWGDSGGMEALKAQAVAARSYGLAAVKGSGCICMTEACQVYKPANKGGKWDEAVNVTRGWVLMANGQPFSAWYASTAGGYTFSYTGNGYSTPGLWDTTGGRGAWTDGAYEKLAGSPWFYKAWYRVRSGDVCGGRNHPWLTSSDMADILNAWKVLFQGGGDAGRIFPPDNCGGGNPYSISELQTIGGFTGVSGVSQVIYGDNGSTISVSLVTNKGEVKITGEEFKKAFNLRAPGNIGIKSSLFNLVKK